MLKKIWNYGTATPIQRCGVILLTVGMVSLLSWVIKKDLSFEDIFDPYYMPKYRDSFIFHAYKYLIPIGLLMSWGYSFLLLIYNWIFSKQTNYIAKEKTGIIYFKNTYEAFKFACKIYPLNLEVGKGNIGLVCNIVLTLDERFQYTIKIANNCELLIDSALNEVGRCGISRNE
ncbi:hypothetical protein, partial [Acinetobacter sp. CFCC 10889]|uniref:hypothetical protein n=1 Tax=Acinetobacter sp. CFCC 10889 TaxID=1775557 RepID=UPI000DCF72BA